MLNVIWIFLVVSAVIIGAFTGKLPAVTAAVTDSAKTAFEIALGLAGILSFWLGIMKLAESAGLIQSIAHLLRPIMRRLFPDVPVEHPAMGAMVLNISSNMLGISNAATPFGLKAMEELEKLNPHPGIATNAMCTFLAINTSSVQLIPTTAIAYLAAAGASHPTRVVITSLIATSVSTIVAVIAVKIFQRLAIFRAH